MSDRDNRRARSGPPEVTPPAPPAAAAATTPPEVQTPTVAQPVTRTPRPDGMYVNGELVQQTKPYRDNAAPPASSNAGDQADGAAE